MNIYEQALFFDAIEPLQVTTCLQFGHVPTIIHPRWKITQAWFDGNGTDNTYDLIYFDNCPDYRSLKNLYEQYVSLATKVVAFGHIIGMNGWRGVAKFWTDIAYESRVDYGEELQLKQGYFEAIEGSEKCDGIGWYYL